MFHSVTPRFLLLRSRSKSVSSNFLGIQISSHYSIMRLTDWKLGDYDCNADNHLFPACCEYIEHFNFELYITRSYP